MYPTVLHRKSFTVYGSHVFNRLDAFPDVQLTVSKLWRSSKHTVLIREFIVCCFPGLVIKTRSQALMSFHRSESLRLVPEMAVFEYGKSLKNHNLYFTDIGLLLALLRFYDRINKCDKPEWKQSWFFRDFHCIHIYFVNIIIIFIIVQYWFSVDWQVKLPVFCHYFFLELNWTVLFFSINRQPEYSIN